MNDFPLYINLNFGITHPFKVECQAELDSKWHQVQAAVANKQDVRIFNCQLDMVFVTRDGIIVPTGEGAEMSEDTGESVIEIGDYL